MIKQVIAIASGKGGVGKSTVAINLAFALKQANHTVGLLDADLYGPSLPLLLAIPNDTVIAHDDNQKMYPIISHDIPTMSLGYLIDEKAPAIWRGPMASKMIQELFFNTQWGILDYLLIDLPPGTGDIHLTLAQKLPLQKVIMVTTPHNIALADVRKSIMMFQKVEVPLVGIIENMSSYECHHCSTVTPLFGEGGGMLLAEEYNTPLLGCLPLDTIVQAKGAPNSESTTNQIYAHIAQQLIKLSPPIKPRRFPKVVVEK